MGLISLTLPNDGETIDAADVNSPLNTIATAINGNLDNANIKTAAAIDGSKIASASLTSTQMADSVSPVKRWDEGLFDFVASGCVWSGDAYGSTRAASMTAGVIYVNGKRVSVSAVTARSFTASKDTYVDVDESGTISYSEVTNNAASPSLAANSIRIGIIVTGASNIANVGSINQGQTDKLLPIASSVAYTVTDSLGNLICNRDPNPSLIGYRQYATDQTGIGAEAMLTGLSSIPAIVPTGRRIRIRANVPTIKGGTAGATVLYIKNGTTTGSANLGVNNTNIALGSRYQFFAEAVTTPTAGLNTYGVSLSSAGSNSDVSSATITPSFVTVEVI